MALEYRVYHVGAEVVSRGRPNAPIRIYQVTAEIVRTVSVTTAVTRRRQMGSIP